jgi:hypothetical protein
MAVDIKEVDTNKNEIEPSLDEQEIHQILKGIVDTAATKEINAKTGVFDEKVWSKKLGSTEGNTQYANLRVRAFPNRYNDRYDQHSGEALGYVTLEIDDPETTELSYSLHQERRLVKKPVIFLGKKIGHRTTEEQTFSGDLLGIRNAKPEERKFNTKDKTGVEVTKERDRVNLTHDETVQAFMRWLPIIRKAAEVQATNSQ